MKNVYNVPLQSFLDGILDDMNKQPAKPYPHSHEYTHAHASGLLYIFTALIGVWFVIFFWNDYISLFFKTPLVVHVPTISCPTDMRICSDESMVKRVAPTCEFATCGQ